MLLITGILSLIADEQPRMPSKIMRSFKVFFKMLLSSLLVMWIAQKTGT